MWKNILLVYLIFLLLFIIVFCILDSSDLLFVGWDYGPGDFWPEGSFGRWRV